MKNPILVPESREYFSHNNFETLGKISRSTLPAIVAVVRFFSLTGSVVPIQPPISERSPFRPVMGGLRHG